jgi:hypothetical protein
MGALDNACRRDNADSDLILLCHRAAPNSLGASAVGTLAASRPFEVDDAPQGLPRAELT